MKMQFLGFICPVHTPDGTPCGLLNHLARGCSVVTRPGSAKAVEEALGTLSMKGVLPILLEGRVIGRVSVSRARKIANELRLRKVEGNVPAHLEVCLIEAEEGVRGQYPGLYLFVGVGRLVRTTLNLPSRQVELLGTLEHVYLQVASAPEDLIDASVVPSHLELSKTSFLSNLACLIPMPDCNQSPRNMYQCQVS
jgi:DNA-directed RNA polymerase I subunit RPA2